MIYGIDFGSVDGNKINYETLRAKTGCSFVIMRCALAAKPDKTFAREFPRALDAGLVVGAYWLPWLPSQKHPKVPSMDAQGNVALKQLDKVGYFKTGTGRVLPPTYDIEIPGGRKATRDPKTGKALTALQCLDLFVDGFKLFHTAAPDVTYISYTSDRFWDEDLGDLACPSIALNSIPWLARYAFKTRKPAVYDASRVDEIAVPPDPRPWRLEYGIAGSAWIHQYQGDGVGVPGTTSTTDQNRFFIAKKGTTGGRVRWLQRQLHVLPVSGKMDAETIAALKLFQKAKGLVPDGIVGARTLPALCGMPT